jgi:hypothetical protein
LKAGADPDLSTFCRKDRDCWRTAWLPARSTA